MRSRNLPLLGFSVCPPLTETRLSLYLKTRMKLPVLSPCTPRSTTLQVLTLHKTSLFVVVSKKISLLLLQNPSGRMNCIGGPSRRVERLVQQPTSFITHM
ncbi:hypothetical protein LguiB_031462 [Lonicera macranthoides]